MEENKLQELEKTISTLKGKLTTLSSEKEEIEKEAEEKLKKIIYEKKKEIEGTYSEVLTEAEKRLKVIESEKEKEKKKNLDSLVEKNTRSVRENNVYLNNEIKRLLKENKMPQFVNSHFYQSIWTPSKITEFLTLLITLLIIALIPTVFCFLVFKEEIKSVFSNDIIRMIIIACIYLAVFFIFGGIWLIIDKMSKKNMEVLKEVKKIRKNISDNKKEIEKIKKDTSKNMTDEQFDYTKLDREIEAGKIEVENYKTKREEAMNNFLNNTEEEIKNKIKAEVKVIIDEKDVEIEKTKEELSNIQKEYDELKLKECDEKVKDTNS